MLQSLSAVILEPKNSKSVTAYTSSAICHEVMGPDGMILFFECWVASQLFHLSLSSSSRSSLVPLRFLPLEWYHRTFEFIYIYIPIEFLILACNSSSPAFWMMHSAQKLNKQGDNIQPGHTPFPIFNQSTVLCPVLTVASWPAYRFIRRQVRWSGIPVS